MSTSPINKVSGVCPHDCPDTCATITEVQDGQAIAFYARPDHPHTQGWLCAKVRPYLERVYHPERLHTPLRRVGAKGSGAWQAISWEAAIAEIATRWQQIIARYSAAAILPYSYSGTLGLLQNAVCEQRLWNRMGASGLIRSICGAAAEHAVTATLGRRLAPPPEQVLHSKLVLLWGHNPASTGPHFMPLLRQAQQQGCYVVVIDPRRTRTARSADQHIQPRPATDGALALGLMHVIVAEGLHDEAWLQHYATGWDDLRERLQEYPPQRVAAITGVPEATINALARRFATTSPTLVKFADGLQRHGNGGQTVRALACLPALTGQYGILGGGLSYSTGGYIAWNGAALAHQHEYPPVPRSVNMNRLGAALTGEVQDPPIMSLYVFNANPVTSTPNTGRILQGLQHEDLFTVVHDLFMTDTARYADLVLPATSQLEHADIHKAYGQVTLQYNAPAIAPLGESKSNWDVMRLLAAALGYHEPWLQQTGEEVLREVLDATRTQGDAFTRQMLAGITLERLQREGSVRLNLPAEFVPFRDPASGTPHFFTGDGKIQLRCDALVSSGLDALPTYALPAEFAAAQPDDLILITGAPHHFVSGSLGNQASLRQKEGSPFIEINPHDAAARGIRDGMQIVVSNARGSCQLRAVITDDVLPGVVVAPKGHWGAFSPDGRNVNWTTSDAIADLAGQSTFHSNLVRLTVQTQGKE